MRDTKAILFDLDGTVWDGSEGAPGALAFLRTIRERDLPHLFLSNNSWQTPAFVAGRLTRLGIPATPDQVLTAGAASGPFIAEQLGLCQLLVVGSNVLCGMLAEAGHTIVPSDSPRTCDAVVVALADWTYTDLMAAVLAVAKGRPLVAVNLDRTMPGDRGVLLPKPGSLVAAIRYAVPDAPPPLVVGKPAATLFIQALRRLNLPAAEVTMIGDGLETDVAGGRALGMKTVWLHRGRAHPLTSHGGDLTIRDLLEGLDHL